MPTLNHYEVSESEVLEYGLPAAFTLAWLRSRDLCGGRTRLTPGDMDALQSLAADGLAELEVLGLITITQGAAEYWIELLLEATAPDAEAIRELKQQGLTPAHIAAAYEAFTKDVHRNPASIMAEYYRSLPLETLGLCKAFVRFAIQFHAIHTRDVDKSPVRTWMPQIKTLQILTGEGVAKTFIHEKRIEFGELLHGGAERYRRPSFDHHFLEFCRRAWHNADQRRRQLEQQLSQASL